MSKELYRRFTEIYLPGQPQIKDNENFSNAVNKQISDFAEKENVSSYRIINCETQTLYTNNDLNKGYVALIVHVAYIV